MKTIISIFLAILFHNIHAQVLTPNIVNTIPAPIQNHTGSIVYVDGALWVTSLNSIVVKISSTTGQVLKVHYLDTSTNDKDLFGIAFDGNDLWASDINTRIIYQIDTADGTILSQFNLQRNNNSNPYRVQDLHCDTSGFLWCGSDFFGTDSILKCDTAGNILSSFILRNSSPNYFNITKLTGLTFEHSYLWVINTDNNLLYKIDTANFSVVNQLQIPGIQWANGLSFGGGYLWVSSNDSDSIYQIDVNNLNLLESKAPDVLVYPNPCSDYIIIDSPQNVSIAEVYDLSGQLVLRCNVTDNKIGLESLKGGSYIISFTIGESQLSKLIKVID